MSSDDARSAVITAAKAFGIGEATIQEMWAALHDNLHDLCRDAPLTGDYLDLFVALERWESSTGPHRDDYVVSARVIARRLGASA
jgi:hypothetical protein